MRFLRHSKNLSACEFESVDQQQGVFPEMPMNARILFQLGLAVLGFWGGEASAQYLHFGVIPVCSTQNNRENWEPLIADLNKKTGLSVSLYFATNYAAIIDAMRNNKIQVGFFGNKSAIEVVDNSNATVFAQKVLADGSLGYYSHLIVHRSSKLNNISDVLRNSKKLSYGNGDLNSTSGNLVPEYYVFNKNGVDSATVFLSTRHANHETNALAVANRQVDVATNNSGDLARLLEHFPNKHREIKVIWTSPMIPSDPLVMRNDVSPVVMAKIKNFFYTYGASDEREKRILLKIDNLSGFKESTDKQLVPIRQLDLYSRRLKVQADITLNEFDKKAALADIDRKSKSLE